MAVASAAPALSADTITRTLYGPETFRKSSGTSTRTFNVPATQGTLTLRLKNGDDAGPDRIVSAGQTVVLDGRNSSDPENDLITYAWTFTQKPFGIASALDNATPVNPSFVPDLNGIYIASLVVNDGHSNSAPDSVTITATAPSVTVPNVVGTPQASAESAITGAGLAVGNITQAHSATVLAGNVISQNPSGGSTAYEGSYVDLTVSLGPTPTIIPPDPSTVAPPIDRTVATDMLSATSFLYTGANPIQTGVAPGTIELKRAAS